MVSLGLFRSREQLEKNQKPCQSQDKQLEFIYAHSSTGT